MYTHFIWGGCSFSFGSGFMGMPQGDIIKPKTKKIAEDLDIPFDNLPRFETEKYILDFSFPNILSKKFNIPNSINLSTPGRGIETVIRRCISYIESIENINESKIFVGIQLPPMVRINLINSHYANQEIRGDKWTFNYIWNNGSSLSKEAEDFFKNYYDFDYYLMQHLSFLLMFYEYCKSKNIDIFVFGFMGHKSTQMTLQKSDEDKVLTQFVQHEDDLFIQKFPSPDKILKNINYHESTEKFQTITEVYSVEDAHMSLKGHQDCANYIYNYLKNNENFCFS